MARLRRGRHFLARFFSEDETLRLYNRSGIHAARVWLGFAGLLLSAALLPALLPRSAAQEPRLPFTAGERLRYNVIWRLLPAGTAELTVAPDRTTPGPPGRWKATAKASSTGYVSNIYRVEDEYQSSFRSTVFCSSGIYKTIHEGERQREVKVEFDPGRRLGRLEERDPIGRVPPKVEQFAIPDCVQDILSAVYYARTMPLTAGKSFEFPLNDGGKTIQIHVEVQAEEEVSTAAGKFQAVRVEPDVFDGHLFKGKGRIWIWFTKDARRLPVQLRAQIDVGTITATLAEIGQAVEKGK